MNKLIGQMLDGRYEILEVIGTGGMAVVYKAKCHRLNRYVAIKVLKEEYARDSEFRQRFHDESQSVAMLSHPNIVAVYDVSRSGSIDYIVMELIEGITLKEYLARRGPLSWQEVTFFSMQIAKALEHAHSRGIIHRDIKPQNIMLLRDGTLKVADFGIARHMAQQKTENISEAIGSVHYVSPEQARGSHIDNRADLYSFGVVMYEMLTGRLPFEGDSAISVAVQHINSIPLPPSDFVPNIPAALEGITMKAMCPSLSKRYASAGQMYADLERFKNDPAFKVEIPPDDAQHSYTEQEADATRKLTNTGEMRENGRRNVRTRPAQREGRESPERQRSSVKATLIFSVVSVAVFIVGAIYFMISVINPFGGDEDAEVLKAPPLVGKTMEEIKADPEIWDVYDIREGELVYDESVPAGNIISQDPVADHVLKEGQAIVVTISRGPKTITLEDYAGQEYRQADIELRRLGLIPIIQYENDEDSEKDNVIRTEPAAGTELNSGDNVVLVVSEGPEPKEVVVPDVTTMTLAKAEETLRGAGLTPGTATAVDSDKPDGTVIFQAIPAKSKVEENTVVDLQISRNPEPVMKSKTKTFTIIEAEGEVQVEVKVDGETQYKATHLTEDGEILVPLVAEEGRHTIRIIQNGETTYEANEEF